MTKLQSYREFKGVNGGTLHSKTGRDRPRQLRLWLVERGDRSWFRRPVVDLQRGPGTGNSWFM